LQMREFDLKLSLCRRCPFSEYLEDQAGSVDDLSADLVLEVFLLDGREWGIDDEQARIFLLRKLRNFLDLALTHERRGPYRAHPQGSRRNDIDPDRLGETFGLFDPRLGRAPRTLARKLGDGDNRPLAASDLDRAIAVERVQDSSPSSSLPSCSAPRFSEWAG